MGMQSGKYVGSLRVFYKPLLALLILGLLGFLPRAGAEGTKIGTASKILSVSPLVNVTSENLRALFEQGNSGLKAQALEVEGADLRRGYLTRSFLPSVEASAAQESFRKGREDLKSQPDYGVEGRINLWNGGRDKIEEDLRELDWDRQKAALLRQKAEGLSKARTLYWEALYLREWIQVLKQTIKVNEDSLKSAERRIRSGVATQIDRLEFEMQAASLGQNLKAAELEFDLLKDRLALILGLKSKIELNESYDHGHDFEALTQHGEQDMAYWLRENETQALQTKLNAQSLQKAWLPKLEAYAGYHQSNEREEDFREAADRNETYLGLKLRMNISAGFEDSRQARAKALEAEAAMLRLQRDRKELSLHMQSELKELRQLHDQVHDFEESIKRAERYHQMTQSEYGRGVKNSPDVLGSNVKLLEARQKRLAIIRDFQIAKGHLLAKLNR